MRHRNESPMMRTLRQADLERVSAGDLVLWTIGVMFVMFVMVGGAIVVVDELQGRDSELSRALAAAVVELRR